jgi:hypothetical protein
VNNQLITLLKAEKDRVAHEAMRLTPSEGKDIGYEYGKRVGLYAGLELALLKIEQVLSDQAKHDNFL